MNKLHIQYGAAVLAAPVFILLHNTLFQQQLFNLQQISFEFKALFFLIVFYPVVEEFAFRGVIQEFIASKTKQYPSVLDFTVAKILT